MMEMSYTGFFFMRESVLNIYFIDKKFGSIIKFYRIGWLLLIVFYLYIMNFLCLKLIV